VIFGISRDISKLSQISIADAREILVNNFEISLVVLMPNITTKHAITYTIFHEYLQQNLITNFHRAIGLLINSGL